MSTADVGLFGSREQEDLLRPEFTRVLKGYDPEQVESYIGNISEHLSRLERELREAKEQLEAMQRRYSVAREEAYSQVAMRMAEVIRTADQQAERLRRDTDEQANRRMLDAEQQAAQIRREAEADAERQRQEGDEWVRVATADRDRIIGGIASQKAAMLAELRTIRKRLVGVVDLLESAAGMDDSDDNGSQQGAAGARGPVGDSGMDELLGGAEGFDMVLPEISQPEPEN
jgi:cell division initiation protein